MPTTIIKTIGPGGDFTTLQAAVTDTTVIPTNLVSADVLVRLQVRSGAELASTSVVDASSVSRTWDATRRIILEPYPGEGFADNGSKLTNALTYNASNGAAIKFTSGSSTDTPAWYLQGISEIRGLQFKYDDTGAGASRKLFRTDGKIVGCIIDAARPAGSETQIDCTGFSNNLFIGRGGYPSSAPAIIGTRFAGGWNGATDGVQIVGNTFVVNNAGKLVGGNGNAPVVKDNALFGIASISTDWAITPTYCATDMSSLSGTGNVANVLMSNQFQNATSGGPFTDMRVKAGSVLINAGVRDAANTGDLDIVGSSRSTTTPTIGAWEYSSGGGDTTPPTLTSVTVGSVTSSTATGSATTSETGGTVYGIVSTSSTPPSTTQIQAGQTNTGATAVWSANAAVSTTSISQSITGLAASTTYYYHVMHKDAANNLSTVYTSSSFTTSSGGDTTPPTLTDPPTVTGVGATTATGNVSTNEGNGTMYAVVTTSATKPSIAQIQAGQNNAGAAAVWSGNQAISSTGAKTFSITGLTGSTTYYLHAQHKDAANNNSSVVTSASFTTTALGTLTYTSTEALANINGTIYASTSGITYLIQTLAGVTVLTKTAQTTNSSGVPASVTDAALTAGTTYRTIFILPGGGEGMVNLVAT